MTVYTFTFGNKYLITNNPKDILDIIETEMECLQWDEKLKYSISIEPMSKEEYENLPK